MLQTSGQTAPYLETLERLLFGQEEDLMGEVRSWDRQWQVTIDKNGSLFAWGAAMGATSFRPSLQDYGLELGIINQLFDDLEGAYFSPAASELTNGKSTPPPR